MCSERTKERERETETERQRDRDRETERETERDYPNSNSKTLFFSKKPNNYSPLMSRYQITGIIYIHIGMNE